MNALVIYDSVYGNTEKIARAIGAGLGPEVPVKSCASVNDADLAGLDLLVMGSPTQGGRPGPAMKPFLPRMKKNSLDGVRVASFDTRISQKWVGVFGYAAGKIGKHLEKLGGKLAAPPEAFYVTGTQGPLKEGEEERATEWGKGLAENK